MEFNKLIAKLFLTDETNKDYIRYFGFGLLFLCIPCFLLFYLLSMREIIMPNIFYFYFIIFEMLAILSIFLIFFKRIIRFIKNRNFLKFSFWISLIFLFFLINSIYTTYIDAYNVAHGQIEPGWTTLAAESYKTNPFLFLIVIILSKLFEFIIYWLSLIGIIGLFRKPVNAKFKSKK